MPGVTMVRRLGARELFRLLFFETGHGQDGLLPTGESDWLEATQSSLGIQWKSESCHTLPFPPVLNV